MKAERLKELCAEAGLQVLITETWRTKEEQDALYAKGRETPGPVVTRAQYPMSMHCWGVAFDFCEDKKGKEYDDVKFFDAVGEIGRRLGLSWGGDWATFKDRPHFEDRSIAGDMAKLSAKYPTPEKFKETWGK
jgi:peptidoglycan L-alanyl-D-glutamate endopeptidase CwlK